MYLHTGDFDSVRQGIWHQVLPATGGEQLDTAATVPAGVTHRTEQLSGGARLVNVDERNHWGRGGQHGRGAVARRNGGMGGCRCQV